MRLLRRALAIGVVLVIGTAIPVPSSADPGGSNPGANPGNPNGNIGSTSFGFITGSNTNISARVLQIAGKINF